MIRISVLDTLNLRHCLLVIQLEMSSRYESGAQERGPGRRLKFGKHQYIHNIQNHEIGYFHQQNSVVKIEGKEFPLWLSSNEPN